MSFASWLRNLSAAARRSTVSRGRRQPRLSRRPNRLLLEQLEDRVVPSLTPVLLADLNKTTQSSNPTDLVAVGGSVYFAANDGVHGNELWKSDGTAANTKLVADINPNGDSNPANLTAVGTTLYFTATDGVDGLQVWKYDTTNPGAGPTPITTTLGANYGNLTAVGQALYFTESTNGNSAELWKSDTSGTAAIASTAGTNPTNLTAVGTTTLYFSANDSNGIPDLWESSNGSATPVTNSATGATIANPGNMTAVGTTLCFTTDDGNGGTMLWNGSGTSASQLLDMTNTQNVSNLTSFNGKLFLTVGNPNFWNGSGGELGYYDPANPNQGVTLLAGTNVIDQLYNDQQFNQHSASGLQNVNDTWLYFLGADANGNQALWTCDTQNNITEVPNTVGTGVFFNGADVPSQMIAGGSTLYFLREDPGQNVDSLWRANGNVATQITLAGGTFDYWTDLANANGTVFFVAQDAAHGDQLWTTGGTATTASLLKDINLSTNDSDPSNFTAVGGYTYFTAGDGLHGYPNGNPTPELWRTDGTTAGTTVVLDDSTQQPIVNPGNLTAVNGTLYFTCDDGTGSGNELWKTDSTETGAVMAKDINPGAIGSNPTSLTNVNGTLYFEANDGTDGVQLWQSDGTNTGTVAVTPNIHGGVYSAGSVAGVNGTVCFTIGSQLYDWNPSSPATVTALTSGASNLTAYPEKGLVFFAGPGSSPNPSQLWRSDGTTTGTFAVGPSSLSIFDLADVNGTLFFTALVFIPNPDPNFMGDKAFFTGRSDGTNPGTSLADTTSVPGNYPTPLLSDGQGNLYYTASDTTGSQQMWEIDSAGDKTQLTSFPGGISNLAYANGVYFAARDPLTGNEPWTLTNLTTAPNTTTVTSSANNSVAGQELTLTATVAAAGAGVPTGSVAFEQINPDGSSTPLSPPGGVQLIGGTAVLNNVSLPAGTYTIQANYTPNSSTFQSSSGSAGQTVVPVTNLQNYVSQNQFPTDPNTGVPTVMLQSDTTTVAGAVQAIENVTVPTGTNLNVILDLTPGAYNGTSLPNGNTVNVPAGVTLFINGAANNTIPTTIDPATPAFTVASGNVVVSNVTFITTGNAPTILVTGGSLTLRNDTIQESNGGNEAAIKITGGSVDLGTATSPGNDTLNLNGRGLFIDNTGANPVPALGDTFEKNGTPMTDPYRIANHIFDALDAGGGGLVTYVAGNVYVTNKTGSIQRGVDAVAVGGTVNVKSGSYAGYTVGSKPVTIQFQNGPSVTLAADPLASGALSLTVHGWATGDDKTEFTAGSAGAVHVDINGVPRGTFTPTGRLIAYGGAGLNDISVDSAITLSAWLFAGTGNTRLTGGSGNNVLVGGSGTDQLVGGSGRDLMIGGGGSSTLKGNGGDDILIGGYTTYDAKDTALAAIMAEWTSADSFAQRVADLSDLATSPGFANRQNGNYYLIPDGTVFNDPRKDSLNGGSGRDWLFADAADKIQGLTKSDDLTIFC